MADLALWTPAARLQTLALSPCLPWVTQVEPGLEAASSSRPSGHRAHVGMLCHVPWMQFGQMSIGSGKKENPNKFLLSGGSSSKILNQEGKVGKGSPLKLLGRVQCAKRTHPEMCWIVPKTRISFREGGTFINKKWIKWVFLYWGHQETEIVGPSHKLWLCSWCFGGCLKWGAIHERKSYIRIDPSIFYRFFIMISARNISVGSFLLFNFITLDLTYPCA